MLVIVIYPLTFKVELEYPWAELFPYMFEQISDNIAAFVLIASGDPTIICKANEITIVVMEFAKVSLPCNKNYFVQISKPFMVSGFLGINGLVLNHSCLKMQQLRR